MGVDSMKTPEDEAFDDLAQRQGDWGGGFKAKQDMAMHKTQDQNICRHYKQWQHCHICDLESQAAELAGIKAILDKYGLQAIDFVADFKAALAQPEHLRDFFYTCNHCGAEKLVQNGNHHPWCACGSDNFDWGNERPAHPAQEPVAWVWNPATQAWEKVHVYGHWQQGAIYAFDPTMPPLPVQPKVFTTGHCQEKAKPGGCRLHNIHCGFPDCDRKKS